jgi:hypothetical protein
MRRRQKGNMILESALWIPAATILIVFVIQFGKITYTYYALRNSVYTTARYLSVQQGVNFCDLTGDPTIQSAIQFGVTGTTDGAAPPLIGNFTADKVAVNIACVDPASGVVGPCDTSVCGGPAGSPRPDYIVVTIPGGYPVTPRMLFLTLDPIPLAPSVTMPFGGTAL